MMQQTARSGEKAPLFGGRKPLFTQSQLLKLTWPLLVEQFLAVTVGMADTMMVSRCGEAAISGVSLVDMINNLIIVLFSALATGGAVVVSQFLGAREQKSANKSAGQLILLSGILGLGVGVLCFVLARPMIRLFYGSIDADVLDAGTLYLKIIAVSYPFLALYNAGAALFRSMGNSRISMQISVLMNIINIVGNAVCIFGLKMGVDGVAWPSVVSRVVAAVLILGKCYQKGHALQVPRTVQLDVGMTRRILGIGIPSAFENSLFEAGRILVVSMISTFGTVQIAANAVANNLDGMGVIPGKALSLAMITVVGQCVGARDYEQAVHYTRKLTLWAYLTMGLFNGAILLFLRPLVGIYELSGATMELAIQPGMDEVISRKLVPDEEAIAAKKAEKAEDQKRVENDVRDRAEDLGDHWRFHIADRLQHLCPDALEEQPEAEYAYDPAIYRHIAYHRVRRGGYSRIGGHDLPADRSEQKP